MTRSSGLGRAGAALLAVLVVTGGVAGVAGASATAAPSATGADADADADATGDSLLAGPGFESSRDLASAVAVSTRGFDSSRAVGVIVAPGTTARVTATLARNASGASPSPNGTGYLRGTIRNGTGAPIASADVTVVAQVDGTDRPDLFNRTVVGATDADGDYALAVPGFDDERVTYRVTVDRAGLASFDADGVRLRPATTSRADVTLVDGSAGPSPTETGFIGGTVRDATNVPVASADVTVVARVNGTDRPDLFNRTVVGATDADGDYALAVPASTNRSVTYDVTVARPGYASVGTDGVAVAPGTTARIDVTLSADGADSAGFVQGTVRDLDGGPVAGADVTVVARVNGTDRPDLFNRTVVGATDADGDYVVAVPASTNRSVTYDVTAETPSGDTSVGTDGVTVLPGTTSRVDVTIVADRSGTTSNPFPDGVPGLASDPPTDPDDDGEYEDVNGDGSANFFDVVDILFALPTIQGERLTAAQTRALDFDRDEDVDFLDVVTLLFRL